MPITYAVWRRGLRARLRRGFSVGSGSTSKRPPMQDPSTLSGRFSILDPRTAAKRLAPLPDGQIAVILADMHVGYAVEILEEFPPDRRTRIAAATPFGQGQLWIAGHSYPEGTVGRLMERPPAVFREDATIAKVVASLRETIKRQMVVYVFVTSADGLLVGVVAFRELLFARPEQTLGEIMLRDPFHLRADADLVVAMRDVLTRHYPVYPVCDESRRLLGMVKGQVLFEQQAFEISAQAGAIVGVDSEERIATPWLLSLKMRHPWLQINLLTAFAAAAVVGYYEATIQQVVVLAVFLPVLMGQCGNLGSQSLAVTLRGMTLNELRAGQTLRHTTKEGMLGLFNGFLTGLVAAVAMYVLAWQQGNHLAFELAGVLLIAMTLACALSGASGALIPVILRRLGADPVTASGILLTTATDVVSMGLFLGLAAWWLF